MKNSEFNLVDLLNIKVALLCKLKSVAKRGRKIIRNGQEVKRADWDDDDYKQFAGQQIDDLVSISKTLTNVESVLKNTSK